MVSNYLRDCRYNVGTLKDFIYIIPYETSMIDFEIDNGYANVESVNSDTIYKIEGVNANLTSEETVKGRFRFAATTTINVAEMPSNPLFHQLEILRKGKWYVVVENIHGEQFIQTVEFYTDFTWFCKHNHTYFRFCIKYTCVGIEQKHIPYCNDDKQR